MKKLAISFLSFVLLFVTVLSLAPRVFASGTDELVVKVYYETVEGYESTTLVNPGSFGTLVGIEVDNLADGLEKDTWFFVHNSTYIDDTEYEFLVSGSTVVNVFLKNNEDKVAVYLDTNGAVLDVQYDSTPEFGGTTPTKPGYTFSNFSPTLATIDEDTLFVAQYTRSNDTEILVTVNNGTKNPTNPTFNDVVTLSPNTEVDFAYWADEDGQVVSTNPNYQFTALDDIELTAVFDDEFVPEFSVYLQNVTGINSGYQSFLGYINNPDDELYEVIEYGLLVSNEAKVLFYSDDNVEEIPSTIIAPTNEFLRSFNEGQYVSFRGYVIYNENDAQKIVYSDNNFAKYSNLIKNDYTETFNSLTLIGSTYTSGDFTGVNGQEYSFTDARGDVELDGKALLIRVGSLTTTFTDGLSAISFDYRRAFTGTGTRSFEVFIDEELVGTISVPTGNDNVGNFSLNSLNYQGEVELEIRGTGAQKLIDNLKWTTNSGIQMDSKMYGVEYKESGNPVRLGFESVIKGNTAIAATPEIPEGKKFGGWFTNVSLTNAFNSSIPIDAHTIIYAKFEDLDQYTVTFDLNGGNGAGPYVNQLITEGNPAIKPAKPTLDGYTFEGWFLDEGTWEEEWNFDDVVESNIDLHAYWIEESEEPAYAIDLFISEYYHGGSNNKVIEIFNGTGSTIDLSNYRLLEYANANTAVNGTLVLTGTLPHGETYVVYHGSTSTTIINSIKANTEYWLSNSENVMSFNGDDEITLEKNISGTWTVIDSIGQIGANGNINANQTLIRKSDIVQGDNIPNNAWTNSEWTVVSATSATNYGDLGKHTFNPE